MTTGQAVHTADRKVPPSAGRYGKWTLARDVALIAVISLLAEAASYAPKQGRAMFTGDSMQHVHGARALLNDDDSASFAFRKPGYTILLALTGAVTGNMSWSAVTLNHLFLAALPLLAFGIGVNLHSRAAGWIAAVLAIARLQFALFGDRLMSEAFYTFLLTLGIWFATCALRHDRHRGWLLGAGMALSGAWLVRSIGIAPVAALLLLVAWLERRTPIRCLTAWTVILLPLAGAALFECSLNKIYDGRFRTSSCTLGTMVQTRARYFQGCNWPDEPDTQWFVSLLPERSRADAYAANRLDGCVARARAVRGGMDEWTFNSRALRSGLQMYADDPLAFLRSSAGIMTRHLLRRRLGPSLSATRPRNEAPIIEPVTAAADIDPQDHWYAYWFIPQLDQKAGCELVRDMRTQAAQRAPFGTRELWRTLAYAKGHPVASDVMAALRQFATLWPGLALLAFAWLGLHRPSCALLAAAYVLEALIIGVCGSTDTDNERYQFVWMATDTALNACLLAPVLLGMAGGVLGRRTRARHAIDMRHDDLYEKAHAAAEPLVPIVK